MSYFNFVNKYHTSHKSNYIYFGAEEYKKENFEGGVGIEIELDTDVPAEELTKAAFRHQSAKLLVLDEQRDHYYLEKDASLRYGFEMVTQPHTVEAMYEFLNNMSETFDKLLELGATSEARKAGLHIHVTKKLFGEDIEARKENVAKLLYFFGNNPELIKKVGRRKSMKKCKVLPLTTKELALDYVKKSYNAHGVDRFLVDRDVAINIKNNNTIEFRAMQTSLDVNILKAEIALTLHLVNKSKIITWEDANDWDKWFEDASQDVKDYIEMALARPEEAIDELEPVEEVTE